MKKAIIIFVAQQLTMAGLWAQRVYEPGIGDHPNTGFRVEYVCRKCGVTDISPHGRRCRLGGECEWVRGER